MNKININFNNIIGEMKPLHGVGQPPSVGINFSLYDYLKEALVPFSRLHDAKYANTYDIVDIPVIFPDFNADPYDAESYDFAFTDLVITALVERGIMPFFRLGVSIENFVHVKAYHVFPPKDNLKWAQICEGIIRHYTEGWANGFYYDMKYWEIWNEPEGDQMWIGTKEQFFELYKVASKYLKEKFPHLKIGGYASCGFYAIAENADAKNSMVEPRFLYYYEYIQDFLKFIAENNCPLDFFSWHSYDGIENNVLYAKHARELLDKAGYTETEQTLNEWNCRAELRGTAEHTALTCGMMLALQNTPMDSAMFYDARCGISIYSGMFNPLTKKPFLAYYAFLAYAELYRRKQQVEVTMDIPGVYACAAKAENGCIVIANTNAKDIEYSFDITGEYSVARSVQVSETHEWKEVCVSGKLPAHSVVCIYFES